MIGSGFGGAVLACRTAQHWPGEVLVLERGKRYAAGSFARSGGDNTGDGPALEASLNDPVAVAVAPDGVVYVAEYDLGRTNTRLRKLEGGNLTTVAGVGSPGCAATSPTNAPCRLNGPNGLLVAADGSGVYVSEFGAGTAGRIRKWTPDGKLTLIQE